MPHKMAADNLVRRYCLLYFHFLAIATLLKSAEGTLGSLLDCINPFLFELL
jgi:hypothetical protein